MSLLSIVITLVLEQLHALPVERALHRPQAALAGFLEDKFNDGGHSHGAIAWGLGVALPAALLVLLHGLLMYFQPLLAFVLGIAALYLTMGFRQFSHHFTNIHLALRRGDTDEARRVLAQWRGRSGDRLSSSDIARLAIEQALLASHRHVFAPLLWFVVLGPGGALFYRLAHGMDELWGGRSEAEFGEFGAFSRQAFAVIDWLPVRVTASPDIRLVADSDQLEQALINLVRNAVDASLETNGAVAVRWSTHGDWAEIAIDDEGKGLPDTSNLFVPFFTTKPNGSGIGLALSRQIAEAHGGTITLENRVGVVGCRAALRLPLKMSQLGN